MNSKWALCPTRWLGQRHRPFPSATTPRAFEPSPAIAEQSVALTLPLDIAHVANHNILHYICEFPVAPVHNIVSPNQIKQRAIKLDEIIAISLVPNSEIYAAKLSSCQATPKKSIVAGEDGRGHCATCLRKKARARSQELPHCTGISLPFEKVGLDIFHKPNSPPSQLNSAIDDLGKVLGASELLARKHPSWQMDYLSPSCQTPCHLGAASTLSCHTGHLPLYLSAYLLSLPDSSSAHTLC